MELALVLDEEAVRAGPPGSGRTGRRWQRDRQSAHLADDSAGRPRTPGAGRRAIDAVVVQARAHRRSRAGRGSPGGRPRSAAASGHDARLADVMDDVHVQAAQARTSRRARSARGRAGCPSASASSAAWSGPAPPNGTSVKSRGSRPRLTVTTRIERAMLLLQIATMPRAASSRDRPSRSAKRPTAASCSRPRRAPRHRRGRTSLAEPSEHHVRVGDRGLRRRLDRRPPARARRRRSGDRRGAGRPRRPMRSTRRRRRS